MHGATVECLHASPGEPMKPGSKLLDLSVDLGSAFAQDCPPISFYRIILREPVWLRRIEAVPGDHRELDALIAVFSTAEDEDPTEPPARAIRANHAAIIPHAQMWTAIGR
jgi:hypothetical protein